jgi:hypothetical protein
MGPRALISVDLGLGPTLGMYPKSETGLTPGHRDDLLNNAVLIFGKSDDPLSHPPYDTSEIFSWKLCPFGKSVGFVRS